MKSCAAFYRSNSMLLKKAFIGAPQRKALRRQSFLLTHQSPEKKDLLPALHVADTGFADAELMQAAAMNQYKIDLLGPSHLDRQWQSRHNRQFCAENFTIDWQRKKVTCPAGKESSSWSDAKTETAKQVVKVKFSVKDWQICSFRADCAKSKRIRRTLTILPQVQYESQRKIREREKTPEYRKEYLRRGGIEGTISQAVRGFGIRRVRYIGEAKTQVQQVVSATAINFVRINNWLQEVPPAKTRQPLFAKVMRGKYSQN